MIGLLFLAFFFWVVSASLVALDIALTKPEPVRIRARHEKRRR
ncbi:MAG TPA: hypothetical protein VGO50_00010 [Pyrinomonadaceae bacterium]|jgi:hypothetical protein|nr:hypothetical protein [Pyrinomonadaceae bacterium]